MNWFVIVIIGVFAVSVANIFQRLAMKEDISDPLSSSIFFCFINTVILGLFSLYKGFVVPPVLTYPLNFALSTVFYALGTLLLFKAAKKIGASEIAILSSFSAFISIIGGIFFLHESFSVNKFIGTLLIVFSVYLVNKKLNLTENKGIIYAILGTSCYAMAVVSDTFIVKSYDPISYAAVISFFPGLFLLITNPSLIAKLKIFINQKYLINIFIYGFFYSIQAIAFFSALNMGANISQVSPMFKSTIILTTILAVIFLKEREKLWLKLISAGLVTIGVLLIK